MMAKQGHFGVNQPWPALLPDILDDFLHLVETLYEITAVNTDALNAFESFYKIIRITGPGLTGRYADAPVVILHQVDHRQLVQRRKLKCFTDFPLRNRGIAQGTDHHRHFALRALGQFGRPDRIQVFQPLRYTGSGDGLHACCTALVNDGRLVCTTVIRVIIILPSTGEHIIFFSQQLKHQLVRRKVESKHDTLIPVIRTDIIAG